MLRKAMIVLLAAAFYTAPVAADTLLIEGIAPDTASGQPSRGASKAEVREQLGAPVSEAGAVGEPPISSWEYDGFVVYFEHDFVLHSVAKR